MALKQQNRIPNAVTKTLLCVDAYRDYDYCGTLYNPYLHKPVAFTQVKDIIRVLEDFFDSIAYPQPYFEPRTFHSGNAGHARVAAIPQRHQSDEIFQRRGRLATFTVEVLHRQNASWQGTICWLEPNIRSPFRSTLELLKLIDSAIELGVFSA